MSKEAMKLALEALEAERDNYQDWDEKDGAPEYIHEAITALREALTSVPDWASEAKEQPAPATELREQGPVAWMTKTGSVWKTKADETDQPLYTSPPAQRTWQGLTDEDIDYLCELAYENDEELILTVQAKLKEKNT